MYLFSEKDLLLTSLEYSVLDMCHLPTTVQCACIYVTKIRQMK